ncbi:MAG: pyridoxal-phosphate dependent enzyme [Nocardioidaceae bacterium]
MSRLSEAERVHGVVAASAGNHAQGVALAAKLLGIKATVFMPDGAPIPKEKATRGYGAEVIFHGQNIDEALVAARAFEAETGAVLIHPFDHRDIVTGQGTCGLEILDQCPGVKTVVVSTGGGGFIAGIATAIKEAPRCAGGRRPGRRRCVVPHLLSQGRPVALARWPRWRTASRWAVPATYPSGPSRSTSTRSSRSARSPCRGHC